MSSRSHGWVGWSAVAVLLGCQGEVAPGPAVRFSLDNAALRADIRQIQLVGYRDQGLRCDGDTLSGTPTEDPAVTVPIDVSSFGTTFPAAAGAWVFYVLAGNDDFRWDGLKPLAEGCLAADIVAGSSPELEIRLHDLRPDYCGDGTLDPGEDCDRGPDVLGDDCAPNCTWETGVCGNGLLDIDETCDDGGTAAGDGCDENCQTEPFAVNRQYREEEQTTPRIAAGVDASGNDGFVVAWTDSSREFGSDQRPPGIVFGFFDERGQPTANPAGGLVEYWVNRRLYEGNQSQPSVAWSSAGTLVTFVFFQASDFDAYMMAYGTNRVALFSDERHVPSSWSGVNEQQAVVGSHPDHDGYVVVWTTGTAPSRRGTLRLLDGGAEPRTDDIPFETTASGDDFLPAVAVRADGSFAVAWAQGASTEADIRLARFDASGTPAGVAETVTSATGSQTEPSLAFDDDGRLLVTWVDSGSSAIRGRLYPPTGAAEAEFAISTRGFTTGAAESGRVTSAVAAVDGTFFVVWGAQNDFSVRGRLVTGTTAFTRNGVTGDDGEFEISRPGMQPSRARVAIVHSDAATTYSGVAMVVWQDLDDFGGADPLGGIRGRLLPVP
ncbi:MAG: hypothetical protein JXB32_07970 [Deltaproteobacteria bacterium]|nr:hypothetical protein [Deltaproteobacteria bacterium]